MKADAKLASWMGRNRRATALELRAGTRMVSTWQREEHPDDDGLLEAVLEAAEGDAAELTGRVVYELTALLPSGRVIGSTRWTMHGGAGSEDTFTDDPTLANVLKNNQRHLEASQKLLVMALGGALEQANATIARLTEQLQHYSSREFELIQLREELASMKHERELATAEAKARADLHRQVLGEIKPAIPTVLGALAAKFLPPGSVAPVEAPDELVALVRSIPDEQLERIARELTPAQQMALARVWEHALKKMQTAAADDAATNPPTE